MCTGTPVRFPMIKSWDNIILFADLKEMVAVCSVPCAVRPSRSAISRRSTKSRGWCRLASPNPSCHTPNGTAWRVVSPPPTPENFYVQHLFARVYQIAVRVVGPDTCRTTFVTAHFEVSACSSTIPTRAELKRTLKLLGPARLQWTFSTTDDIAIPGVEGLSRHLQTLSCPAKREGNGVPLTLQEPPSQ